MRLTLFDLDNTLLAGDSDYAWGQFLVDRGVLEREAYEAQNRAYYEQYAAGTLDIHEYLGFAPAVGCEPDPVGVDRQPAARQSRIKARLAALRHAQPRLRLRRKRCAQRDAQSE